MKEIRFGDLHWSLRVPIAVVWFQIVLFILMFCVGLLFGAVE